MKDFPICSICKVSTEKTDNEGEYACPQCARIYLPDREIVEYPDEFVTSHSDEMPEIEGISAGTGLLAAEDEDMSIVDQLYRSAKHKPNQGEYAEKWD